jgi:hypothetical protein
MANLEDLGWFDDETDEQVVGSHGGPVSDSMREIRLRHNTLDQATVYAQQATASRLGVSQTTVVVLVLLKLFGTLKPREGADDCLSRLFILTMKTATLIEKYNQ